MKDQKGSLSDAIMAVSTLDIVDAFGVPQKTRKGKTYLLCPGHDDTHFGSCYIDKNDNGYYCYACGEHVSKWDMVLKLNGNNKKDALEWFFDMSGLTPIKSSINDPYQKTIQLIRRLEKYVNNKTVYNDIYTCKKNDSSYGRNINGEYLYSELSISNPLMELYKCSKEAFKNVVLKKLEHRYNSVYDLLKKYKSSPEDSLFVDGAGLISFESLAIICDKIIIDLSELIEEVNTII